MDMNFIIANDKKEELGQLDYSDELEIFMNADDSKSNDFELKVSRKSSSLQHISSGGFIYADGTPYGGCIEEIESESNEDEITFRGFNWIGLMTADIIEPPEGMDYWTYSGEANAGIKQMIGDSLGGLFEVSENDSGIQIQSYQVRYETKWKAVQNMLKSSNAKLKITTVQEESNFKIILEAVPIQNLCEEITYNEDNKININIDDKRWGFNHLVCLGKGELKERQVVHLYIGPDGQVRDTQYFQGFKERKAIYDYSSAQSIEDLKEKGTERLLDISNVKKMEVTVDDEDLDLGDIVGGIDEYSKTTIQKPITRKNLKLQKGEVKIAYKTEGES